MKPTPRLYSDHMITAVLALLSYALFFYGLGSIGLVGPDEPRYAAAITLRPGFTACPGSRSLR